MGNTPTRGARPLQRSPVSRSLPIRRLWTSSSCTTGALRSLASTVAGKPVFTSPYPAIIHLQTRNRSPPDGYRLSRIEFADGQPVEPADSQDAEIPIMWNPDNGVCPNSCFRPCGLAIDSESRIFMSSDTTGEIFLVVAG